MTRRVVLVGVGHAHLGVLASADALVARGVEVVAVSPGDFWYSGRATAVLAGECAPELDRVDVACMAARVGATFVRDAAVAVDAAASRVVLAGGRTLGFDACSIDVGSDVPTPAVPGADGHAIALKPIARVAQLRTRLEARFRQSIRTRVAVVGAGASGCEVAACIDGLARRHGVPVEITLLGRGPRVLPRLPARAARGVARALARRGIRIACGPAVTALEAGEARLDGGGVVPFDLAVVASGLVPPPLAGRSGLAVDDDGALVTDEFLRAAGHPRVFGGGDAIAFRGSRLPRIGVFAVRQAPVLLANLAAVLSGAPLTRFVPQRRWLLVMNLGDGTGLATWGSASWQGRAAWLLKDRIDRRWMARWHAMAGVGSSDAARGR